MARSRNAGESKTPRSYLLLWLVCLAWMAFVVLVVLLARMFGVAELVVGR